MAKRKIVAPKEAPLKDVEKVELQTTETFDLLVRRIPDTAELDFMMLKKKMKAQGITKLPNGDQFSLSGYMKQALLEKLEKDLKG